MSKKRDIGQELLDGVRAIKAGKGKRRVIELSQDVQEIRERLGLSQSAFAALLGVSTRTLQDWEQGRRQPTGAARSLLRVADRHPEALLS
ncbi:MAG: helix-turn-helix domain-containing protein [Gammaproteobacteria bacterium]|nr:helix-turn-helix domain-containing protein [Gammaproteobacteria bacterium]MDJ0892530.1 helix-turn-helix domain-containing protein [Gammaproteobacteria bacterium]